MTRKPKTWREKFLICLKEELTINDIKDLRDVSTQTALDIRALAIDHLKDMSNDIMFVAPKTKIDTEAVFAVTGHDKDYYYHKMLDERKASANA